MSKVLRTIGKVVGTVASFIPGVGQVLGPAILAISSIGGKKKRAALPDLDRLNLTSVAAAPRKLVFGTTAMAADLRYVEPSGTGQRFVDAIIHLASHRCTSVDEIRIDDKVAWTAAGGVQGIFAGFMTVEVILETSASAFHTVNGGANWGSAQRMTGCCTMRLRFDRQGTKKAESPFSAGVPTQLLTIGKGLPVYDPRRDSTVPGGSGPHRIDNQATWQFTDGATDLGNNPALQCLAYLIGWRVLGQVSVGLGLPPSRVDLEAFAAAANICDESILLVGGGSQRRYQGAGLWPDNADPFEVMDAFAASVSGWWDDSRGKIGLFPAVNDLSGGLVSFGDSDILGGVEWQPFPEISQVFNVVRGVNPDPALPANYQPTDYPEIKLTSADGIDRVLVQNFAMVEDKRRAQRLAKQALQRQQYRGLAKVVLGIRAWQVARGQPIRLSFGGLGWVDKLFRIESWSPQLDGSVVVELREENTAIYAWDQEEAPAVTPAAPVVYDPRNNPFLITAGSQIGVDDGATRNIPRGDWAVGQAYAVGDFVNNAGNAYSCVTAHTSSSANEPPSAFWALLVSGGGAGPPGDNVAIVPIHKRGATAPAGPTGSAVFDFTAGTLTESTAGALNGWTLEIPTTDGNPVWRRQAGARNAGGADTITSTEWSIALKVLEDGAPGAPGAPGANAKSVRLIASSQVFQVAQDGTATPASITFDAIDQNLTGSPSFTVETGSATLAGAGNSRTLTFANLASDTARIRVDWDGQQDRVTVVKVREGSDALTGFLSNEAHVVATAIDGTGGDYSAAGGRFRVFLGAVELTSGVVFSILGQAGLVGLDIDEDTGDYLLTGASADQASATFRATIGSMTIDKVYTLAKSREGQPGNDADNLFDVMAYTTPEALAVPWQAAGPVQAGGVVNAAKFVALSGLADSPGGAAVRIGETIGDNYVQLVLRDRVPYSPSDLYAVDFDVEYPEDGVNAQFFAGVAAYNSAGALIPGNGSFNYVAALGVTQLAGRFRYRGYFQGVASSGFTVAPNIEAPSPLGIGAVAFSPVMLLNFRSTGTSQGRVILHSVRWWRVLDNTPIPVGAWLSTTSYRSGQVVNYLGRSFMSRVNGNLNNTPPGTASSNSFWLLLADKGDTGDPGPPGVPAKALRLSASSQVFAVSKAGVASPASIGFSAFGQNLAGSPSYAVTAGTATLTGTGNNRTLTFANLATDTATIEVSWDGLTDQITVAKVREGIDALTGLLTNEAHTVATEADGTGGDYAGAAGLFLVYRGDVLLTSGVTYSVVSGSAVGVTGATIGASSGAYSVSGSTLDQGSVTFRATVGSVSVDKVFTVAKARRGVVGATGSPGLPGDPGNDGLTLSALPDVVQLRASSAGVIEPGQLPYAVNLVLRRGGSDQTSAATWGAGATNLTFTAPSAGAYLIQTVASLPASLLVTATLAGEQAQKLIVMTAARDGLPGNRIQDDSLTINNTASYLSSGQGGPVQLTVGPGTIKLEVAHGYVVSGVGTGTLSGKVQCRTTPGSGPWVDVGSETTGDPSLSSTEPGLIEISETLAGPVGTTANWEFRYLNRRSAGTGTLIQQAGGSQLFQVSQ